MVGGSQPCVDLLRKTIRAIDSRKLLSFVEADICFVEAGKVSVAGTAAAGTVHTQLAQYPAAGTENSTAVHMYMYM